MEDKHPTLEEIKACFPEYNEEQKKLYCEWLHESYHAENLISTFDGSPLRQSVFTCLTNRLYEIKHGGLSDPWS